MRPVIALVGMRGAGKTTVGTILAARLGLSFADTDDLVRARLGVPIREVFAAGHEDTFRSVEGTVVRDALATGPAVVATGGGAVEDPATRMALAGAFTVWLTCPAPILAARVVSSDRPSVTGADLAVEVPSLLARRAPFYAACARIALDTAVLDPDEVCDAIEHAWRCLPDHDVR